MDSISQTVSQGAVLNEAGVPMIQDTVLGGLTVIGGKVQNATGLFFTWFLAKNPQTQAQVCFAGLFECVVLLRLYQSLVCVRLCVGVCVYLCVSACVCVCVCVCALCQAEAWEAQWLNLCVAAAAKYKYITVYRWAERSISDELLRESGTAILPVVRLLLLFIFVTFSCLCCLLH